MLTAEQRELVAAAVDGELSAAESRASRELLDASAEARDLFEKLTSDSGRLRTLPRVQVAPPPGLRAKVLARITAITPPPRALPGPLAAPAAATTPAAPARSRRLLAALAPFAVAAAILVGVTLGSFAFFSNPGEPGSATAKHPWADVLPAPHRATPAIPSPNAVQPRPRTQPDPDSVAHSDFTPVPPLPLPKEVLPKSIPVAPEPRPARHDLVASPLLPPIPPFDLVEVRIPFLRAVAELEREDTRQELAEALGHDPARIDLFVRDTARGVDVFQNAAKAAGLHVFADAATLEKLKKRQAHAVVVYVECLNREELADLFGKLSAADTKFTPRVCDSLHAAAVVRSDEHELKAILGTDAGLYKRPQPTRPRTNPHDKNRDPKSVNSGTIDTVTQSLTKPAAKSGEKRAILMTWQTTQPGIPRTHPSASSELKQFLAKRGDRKPDAVPAIIVIRPAG
jgi:hypothetical protein